MHVIHSHFPHSQVAQLLKPSKWGGVDTPSTTEVTSNNNTLPFAEPMLSNDSCTRARKLSFDVALGVIVKRN